jgi:hypothetical protein
MISKFSELEIPQNSKFAKIRNFQNFHILKTPTISKLSKFFENFKVQNSKLHNSHIRNSKIQIKI